MPVILWACKIWGLKKEFRDPSVMFVSLKCDKNDAEGESQFPDTQSYIEKVLPFLLDEGLWSLMKP